MNNIKNNNGISLIDKENEIKDYLETAIFKEGCGAQEPYGDESIIMYQRLTKELALKGQKALVDLGYYVNIVCESSALDSDKSKYCLIYASNANEMKEATEHTLENGRFFVALKLENSGFDHNQTLKFYDKDNKLKCVYYTSSGQFHNAEQIGLEILNENPNLSYAIAVLKDDAATITRIGEENKKIEYQIIQNAQVKTKEKTKMKSKSKSNDYGMGM